MTIPDESPKEWKEKGNEAFKKGNLEEALQCYTNAIKLSKEDNTDKMVYLKNRAAVYLKQGNHKEVIKDCDEALKICPNDPKALYRRCLALKTLERYEEAYRDAKHVISVDPTNKEVKTILAELFEIVQERLKQRSKVSSKVFS